MIYALLVMTSFNQNRRLAPTLDLYMNSKHNAHITNVYNYIILKCQIIGLSVKLFLEQKTGYDKYNNHLAFFIKIITF